MLTSRARISQPIVASFETTFFHLGNQFEISGNRSVVLLRRDGRAVVEFGEGPRCSSSGRVARYFARLAGGQPQVPSVRSETRDGAKEEVRAECAERASSLATYTSSVGKFRQSSPPEIHANADTGDGSVLLSVNQDSDEGSPTSTTLDRKRPITNIVAVRPSANFG